MHRFSGYISLVASSCCGVYEMTSGLPEAVEKTNARSSPSSRVKGGKPTHRSFPICEKTWNARREKAGLGRLTWKRPIERQQPAGDDHADPQRQGYGRHRLRGRRRRYRRAVYGDFPVRGQIESERIQSSRGDEQHLDVKRRVIDVLVRFGEQKCDAADSVDAESDEAPGNQSMHRGDRNALSQAEQTQVEETDGADQ